MTLYVFSVTSETDTHLLNETDEISIFMKHVCHDQTHVRSVRVLLSKQPNSMNGPVCVPLPWWTQSTVAALDPRRKDTDSARSFRQAICTFGNCNVSSTCTCSVYIYLLLNRLPVALLTKPCYLKRRSSATDNAKACAGLGVNAPYCKFTWCDTLTAHKAH